jgi:hypothetical protein
VDQVMRTIHSRLTVLGLLAVLLATAPVFAQVEITGFAQTNYTTRTTGEDCPAGTDCDFLLGEERIQLKFEDYSWDGSAAFVGKVDLFHDAIMNESGIEIREAYVDWATTFLTLRAGRQIITWGVGDLLFVNGTFPKDWVSFFAGRPMQYLKVGSDALKIGLHPGFVTAEVVLTPVSQPDRYPTGERLILDDPFPGMPRSVEVKDRSFENMEIAAKLSRYISNWEVAAYVSRGFYRTPAVQLDDPTAPTEVRFTFPRLNTYGGSLTGGMAGGVLNVETAYYDSGNDRNGDNAAIENCQIRTLVGYSRPLWEDGTLGVQGYVESMQNYDTYLANLPAGAPKKDEQRATATLRFSQLLLHQTVTFNFFTFWGISDQDAYIIPSLRYAFSDELWGELGANIFIAKNNDTMFGSFDKNDNVFFTLRYGF